MTLTLTLHTCTVMRRSNAEHELIQECPIKTSRRKVRSHNRKLYRPCVTHYSRACWCRASGKTFNVPCTMEREYSVPGMLLLVEGKSPRLTSHTHPSQASHNPPKVSCSENRSNTEMLRRLIAGSIGPTTISYFSSFHWSQHELFERGMHGSQWLWI